jgi:hypothetical protein
MTMGCRMTHIRHEWIETRTHIFISGNNPFQLEHQKHVFVNEDN